MAQDETDGKYLKAALALARKGYIKGKPSPYAGAVVVARDDIAGRSFASGEQARCALVSALKIAGPLARGACLYTNIDPFAIADDPDYAIEAMISSRICRIAIGALLRTSYERYASAIRRVKDAGIEIDTGTCEAKCRSLNEVFFKFTETGLPFVTVKYAQTLDGRIATRTGDSKWISGPQSLKFAHRLRSRHEAILVGINTVLADDPQLTVRHVRGMNPLRIIVDSNLRIGTAARVLSDGGAKRTIIATLDSADRARIGELERAGAEVWRFPARRRPDLQKDHILETGSRVDIKKLLIKLGGRSIKSVLVEGGAGITTSMLSEGLVDRLVVAVAPKLIGTGIESIGDLGITQLSHALTFSSMAIKHSGDDIIFDCRFASR